MLHHCLFVLCATKTISRVGNVNVNSCMPTNSEPLCVYCRHEKVDYCFNDRGIGEVQCWSVS